MTIPTQLARRPAAVPLLSLVALPLALLYGGLTVAQAGAEELPPKFREAVDLFGAGDFRGCQIAFGQAASEAPRAGLAARAAYGAACCAAQRPDIEGAFAALTLALSKGFVDLDRALADPRLETLHADGRWFQFISLAEERLLEHRKTLDSDLLRLFEEQRRERSAQPGSGIASSAASRASSGAAGSSAGSSANSAAGATERSEARRRETRELVEKGRVRQPRDAFHAAAMLVESERPEEVARAAALARQALAGDPDLLAARPVVAAAVDRGEMLAGRPQKYGTQLVEEGGAIQVYAVDPSITDAERAEWGVPPLAQTRARVAELNRPPTPPAPPAPVTPAASPPP